MRWIALTICTLLFQGAASAGRIELKPSAIAPESGAVTLKDVADLEGPNALALADVVIIEDFDERAGGRAWVQLAIDDVRTALDARRVNWGRISLQGRHCTVRLAGALITQSSDDHVAPATRAPETVDLTGNSTVRTRIVSLLLRVYDVDSENLRVLFNEDDKSFLDLPDAGRRIEVQPASTGSSSRFAVVVWLYAGDQLLETRTMRIDLQVRRRVFVLSSELERGDAIRESHLRSEFMWLEPTGPAPVLSQDKAINSVARRRLTSGTVLRVDHLESPVVVRRGELVTIHCISGGVVVKTRARAQDDAREGELVEMRVDGRRKTFVARVVGAGRAIMNLDSTSSAALSDASNRKE